MIRPCLAAAVVGAIAAGVASAASSAANPRLMVLRLPDLPAGFGSEDGRYVGNVQAAKETTGTASVRDFLRWGRITGYEANFTRRAIVGLIRVQSSASTYKSVRGAADSLHASFREAARTNANGYKYKRLSAGGPIGHESRLYAVRTKSGGTTIDLYLVAWRYLTVKAVLVGGGVAGTVPPETVVRLARKQQPRIVSALR